MFELLNLLKKTVKERGISQYSIVHQPYDHYSFSYVIAKISLSYCAICTLYYYTYCNTKLSIQSIQEYD